MALDSQEPRPSLPSTRRHPRAKKDDGNSARRSKHTTTSTSARIPGIRELAARLGLGISTVSRAMNNRDRVDAKTRQRVMEMARKIGYVPDATARRLKSHPRLRVEVFFSPYPDPNHKINPAALLTVDALKRRSAERGIFLTVREFAEPGSASGVSVAAELAAHVAEHAADVIVTYGHFHDATLAVLREGAVPVVCLQSLPHGPRQIGVTVDTRTAAYQAVTYLAALGHLRFALISGGWESLHHRGYIEGFADAVNEFKLSAPEAHRITLAAAEINGDGAMRAVAPLLATPADERPTAFVFGSDWLALGGVQAVRAANLTIPGDVSLIGFDNVAEGAALAPALTTFDVHHESIADAVLDAATELMENRHAPATDAAAVRTVRADLVKRGSCATWGR